MTEPAKATARSPFAGCAIFICVFVMMIFLIVISIVTFFRQYKEIAKFTDDKPVPVAITPIEDREADLNRLAERLEVFRQELADEKDTSLALSADDLNTAMAAYDSLKDFRGTFRIEEIGEKDLRIAASFPLNGMPRLAREGESGGITTDHRYLNGTIIARPELFEGEMVLQISDIQVPGKTVVKEFIERMSPYRVTERYKTDPILGPTMKKLTGVELSRGNLVLRRKAGEIISTTITDQEVDVASSRLVKFLAIGASVFLLFVACMLFLGLRKKRESV
ncbi:MAG: hypothetical protein EOP87_24255 [Verrucomicrobiaceae bacterium]|nr:MAG: hypothetical protein EOP87_24255 [Verrucomicrobiaceae bacterium]